MYDIGGGPRTTCRSWFSPTLCSGIRLRSTGLTASVFTPWAIHPVASLLLFLLPSLFDLRTHCIAQAGLELAILMPQPSRSYNSRHVPPSPAKRGFLTSRFVYMRSLTSVLLVSDFFLGTVYPVIICSTS